MKLYSFAQNAGKPITAFDSNFIMARIAQTRQPATVGCMHLPAGGVVGFHQAPVEQLLLIVAGTGMVRSEEDTYIQVQAGDAVYWGQGEWHATKTESGLTAIVIESEDLALSPHLLDK